MRNLLAFVGAVVVTVGGLGWYLGWYQVQTSPTAQGHRGVNIDFDTKKIGSDLQRGGQKLHDLVDRANKGAAPATGKDAAGKAKAPGTEGRVEPHEFGAGENAEQP